MALHEHLPSDPCFISSHSPETEKQPIGRNFRKTLDQAENEECRFDENGACAFGCECAECVHASFQVEGVELKRRT